MIRAGRVLSELEEWEQREAYRDVTYTEALGRIASLWAEACALNPDIGEDWREDIASNLAVARAINGLSPTA
jgi:hypothetical protein